MVHAVLPSTTTTGGRYLPEQYRGGWLLFAGGERRFRVAPIPGDWQTCPIGDLLRLLARAEVADRSARRGTAEPPLLRSDAGDAGDADRA